MSDEEQHGPAQSSNEPDAAKPQDEDDWTDFGYGFAMLFFALLVFFAPWYYFGDPFPSDNAALIISVFLYVVGSVIVLFGINFFNTGVQKTPELRQLFPSLSAGEDAWQAAFGAMTFLVIILGIHLLIRGFDMTGIGALAAKILIYFMAILGITQVAQAIDGFVIRPLIATAAKGPREFEPLLKRVRQVGVLELPPVG